MTRGNGAAVLWIISLGTVPIDSASAHASDRAYVLLLPTELYIVGGALVVALSFVVAALLPAGKLPAVDGCWKLPLRVSGYPVWPSAVALALLGGLVAAGLFGSRDPLENPLPLMVWSLWWVGLVLLHVLFGNLWSFLTPLRAAYRLLRLPLGLARRGERPLRGVLARLGYWPAALLFFGFAWFELIYPAPQDPERLAYAIVGYVGVSVIGMLVFGERDWLQRADPLSVFFRMTAWLAPLTRRADGRLVLRIPGARLVRAAPLPVSGVAFVLLAIACVSFDGLSRTFWWLGRVGVNPLEHPGRTALVGVNSVGLIGTFLCFAAAYAVTLRCARVWHPDRPDRTFGRVIYSIVPIALGYHAAHYLPALLIDGRLALRALSDPFAAGWDLIGTARLPVPASLLGDHRTVELIWRLQTAIIVVAHVAAVGVAHLIAVQTAPTRRAAALSQAPVTVLMIAYTVFGLWLLSTATAG